MAVAGELGVEVEVIPYMKQPPDRETLQAIVAGLEGPVGDLVRKDSKFKKLGLDEADYVDDPDAVVDLLVEHKALLQRPVLVKGPKLGNRSVAIIGRPKDRIYDFLR